MQQISINTPVRNRKLPSFQVHDSSDIPPRKEGFRPGFMDTRSGKIYSSRFKNGTPVPLHIRNKNTDRQTRLVAGFIRKQRFYTREEAALFSYLNSE